MMAGMYGYGGAPGRPGSQAAHFLGATHFGQFPFIPAPIQYSAPPPANDPTFSFDGCNFEIQTVVAAGHVSPHPGASKLKNGRWEEALRKMVLYSTGSDVITAYDPSVHAARAVTFGDSCVVLIYPTGRVVAYGNKSEGVVLHQLHLALSLIKVVTGTADARYEPMTRSTTGDVSGAGPSGSPQATLIIENMVVSCRTVHPALLACLRSDVLFLEKLPLRFPGAAEYSPEVCPAALVRPHLGTSQMETGKYRKYTHPAVQAMAASEADAGDEDEDLAASGGAGDSGDRRGYEHDDIDTVIARLLNPLAGKGGPWYSHPVLSAPGPLISIFESGLLVFSHVSTREMVLDAFWALKHRMLMPFVPPPLAVPLPEGSTDAAAALRPGPMLPAGPDGLVRIPPRPRMKWEAPGLGGAYEEEGEGDGDEEEADGEGGSDAEGDGGGKDEGEDEEGKGDGDDGDGDSLDEGKRATNGRHADRDVALQTTSAARGIPFGSSSASASGSGVGQSKGHHHPSTTKAKARARDGAQGTGTGTVSTAAAGGAQRQGGATRTGIGDHASAGALPPARHARAGATGSAAGPGGSSHAAGLVSGESASGETGIGTGAVYQRTAAPLVPASSAPAHAPAAGQHGTAEVARQMTSNPAAIGAAQALGIAGRQDGGANGIGTGTGTGTSIAATPMNVFHAPAAAAIGAATAVQVGPGDSDDLDALLGGVDDSDLSDFILPGDSDQPASEGLQGGLRGFRGDAPVSSRPSAGAGSHSQPGGAVLNASAGVLPDFLFDDAPT